MPDVILNDDANDYTDPAGLSNRIFGRGGNDTLRGGDGNDTLIGGTGSDSLYGGSGFDQAEWDQDATGPVQVNLQIGEARGGPGGVDRLFDIEGARGTNFGDTFIGGVADNLILGLGGNDLMSGGLGADTLDGGAGSDTVEFVPYFYPYPNQRGITVNLITGTADDGLGYVDTLIGIENAIGTRFADSFVGNAANNFFRGHDDRNPFAGVQDDDTFAGGSGFDTFEGGIGFDEVRYDQDAAQGGSAGVIVNLVTNGAIDGFGHRDTLSSIEAARGTRFADSFYGAGGDDRFTGLAGADSLRGGDGFDEASYELDARYGGTAGIVADLTARTVVDGFGATDWLRSIEAIIATNSVDRLTGDDADNGFAGLRGSDTILGGGGFDEARYDRDAINGGAAGVIVNLVTQGAIDGFGNRDTLIAIEAARGTASADSFFGSSADNLFSGLAGNDTIRGGDGVDVASYLWDYENGATAGIVADLNTGIVRDGFGATDRLSGIEGVIGTRFVDRLIGDAGDNTFDGGGGGYLNGSLDGGRDVIDGGAGIDTVSFQSGGPSDGDGVTVHLYDGMAFGVNFVDLYSIENVRGSADGDQIIGDFRANVLWGEGGDDRIFGSAGNDTLIGGDGNDYLSGSDGADQLIGGDGLDRVWYMYDAVLVDLAAPAANTGEAAGDTYSSIEGVLGSEGSDTIFGDNVANNLVGGSGHDIIDGRGGADYLSGSSGNDTFRFSTALGAGNVDIIEQFRQDGQDRIMLDSRIFAGIGATLDASEFGGGPGENRFIFYAFEQALGGGTFRLFYDAGGSESGPGPVQFATLARTSLLDVSDFVMV